MIMYSIYYCCTDMFLKTQTWLFASNIDHVIRHWWIFPVCILSLVNYSLCGSLNFNNFSFPTMEHFILSVQRDSGSSPLRSLSTEVIEEVITSSQVPPCVPYQPTSLSAYQIPRQSLQGLQKCKLYHRWYIQVWLYKVKNSYSSLQL